MADLVARAHLDGGVQVALRDAGGGLAELAEGAGRGPGEQQRDADREDHGSRGDPQGDEHDVRALALDLADQHRDGLAGARRGEGGDHAVLLHRVAPGAQGRADQAVRHLAAGGDRLAGGEQDDLTAAGGRLQPGGQPVVDGQGGDRRAGGRPVAAARPAELDDGRDLHQRAGADHLAGGAVARGDLGGGTRLGGGLPDGAGDAHPVGDAPPDQLLERGAQLLGRAGGRGGAGDGLGRGLRPLAQPGDDGGRQPAAGGQALLLPLGQRAGQRRGREGHHDEQRHEHDQDEGSREPRAQRHQPSPLLAVLVGTAMLPR